MGKHEAGITGVGEEYSGLQSRLAEEMETEITSPEHEKLRRQLAWREEVIIAKGNKPIVKLVLVPEARPKRKLGSAKGLITISPDFDEPLNDFKDYM